MKIDQRLRFAQTKRYLDWRTASVLMLMATLMTTTMIVANLAAAKIWALGSVPVDGGLLLFPLSYVLGDLLVEIYGRRTANAVAWAGCLAGLLTAGVIALTKMLPDYPGADNSGFEIIASSTGRIFLASIVGFIASQLLNNYIFARDLQRQRRRGVDSFLQRALISSALAHIPDILLFEPIAFWGKLSAQEFVSQAVFAYGAAIAVEGVLLLLVTQPLARGLVNWLRFQHGERIW